MVSFNWPILWVVWCSSFFRLILYDETWLDMIRYEITLLWIFSGGSGFIFFPPGKITNLTTVIFFWWVGSAPTRFSLRQAVLQDDIERQDECISLLHRFDIDIDLIWECVIRWLVLQLRWYIVVFLVGILQCFFLLIVWKQDIWDGFSHQWKTDSKSCFFFLSFSK